MKEQLIKFETAKLAKEKRFDIPVRYGVYGKKMKLTEDWGKHRQPSIKLINWNADTKQQKHSKATSVPTQSLLQKWLRKKYKIDVCLHPLISSKRNNIEYSVYYVNWNERYFAPKHLTESDKIGTFRRFDSPEQALEKGLQEALKLIDS